MNKDYVWGRLSNGNTYHLWQVTDNKVIDKCLCTGSYERLETILWSDQCMIPKLNLCPDCNKQLDEMQRTSP
jgi:hypothetical protein